MTSVVIRSRQNDRVAVYLEINGIDLERVSEFGVIVDENLSWMARGNMICHEMSKYVGILNKKQCASL